MTDLGSPDLPGPKSRFPKEMPGSPDYSLVSAVSFT